jgi:8-oxo-dGTP pyrophosphatase MutT (NUDIX family)
MDYQHLVWTEESRKEVYRSKVFTVRETQCRSPMGETNTYQILDASDWAIIIPTLNERFVMVRQWRHGANQLSLEFPGGVIEKGETPDQAAARELEEETAYKAGTITKLGAFSPNPAIMSNHVYFFLAQDLSPLPSQHLDDDEFLDVQLMNQADFAANLGKPPLIHALMGAAYALYLNRG